MGGVRWDDAEWRAHEAEQVRIYIDGRKEQAEWANARARLHRDDQFRCCVEALLTRAEIVDANRAALLAVAPESAARVHRLLQEQKAWDGYFTWGGR